MITFQPDPAPLFKAGRMASILRGRIHTRQALLAQAEGETERLKHEQVIAECEQQIEQLQGAVA